MRNVILEFQEKYFNLIQNSLPMSLQTDPNTEFLRAARAGDLGKLIDFLESGEVTDINTCNAVSE